MTNVTAQLRYLRMAPRKVRFIADLVRNMSAIEAEHQLVYNKRRAAGPILKLLRSAIANAKNNFALDKEKLFIKTIQVDQGPSLKRIRMRAQGRSALILKRSSHVKLMLGERKGKVRSVKAVTRPEVEGQDQKIRSTPQAAERGKSQPLAFKKPYKKTKLNVFGQRVSGFTKRIFRRKSI